MSGNDNDNEFPYGKYPSNLLKLFEKSYENRGGKVVIGEVLVNTEFPFPGLAKLVTYLMIVTVVGW